MAAAEGAGRARSPTPAASAGGWPAAGPVSGAGADESPVTPVWSAALTSLRLQAGVASPGGRARWGQAVWAVRGGVPDEGRVVGCRGAGAGARARGPRAVPSAPGPVDEGRGSRTAAGRRSRLRREGRGRALDHGCGARGWRPVPAAAVERRDAHPGWEARHRCARSGLVSHEKRRQQARGDRPPAAVYQGCARGAQGALGNTIPRGPPPSRMLPPKWSGHWGTL